MVFYRHAKIFIGFDCEDPEGKVRIIYGGEVREMVFEPVIFESRSEAYSIWGDPNNWADKMAENIAKAEAEGYCGNETFRAINIDWLYSDVKEWSDIPKFILNQIELIETIIKEVETVDEKIALEEELIKLKERYEIE